MVPYSFFLLVANTILLYFQVALVKKYHTNGDLYTSFQSQTLRYLNYDFALGVPRAFRRLEINRNDEPSPFTCNNGGTLATHETGRE